MGSSTFWEKQFSSFQMQGKTEGNLCFGFNTRIQKVYFKGTVQHVGEYVLSKANMIGYIYQLMNSLSIMHHKVSSAVAWVERTKPENVTVTKTLKAAQLWFANK